MEFLRSHLFFLHESLLVVQCKFKLSDLKKPLTQASLQLLYTGISVDHRRRNKSVESLQTNVQVCLCDSSPTFICMWDFARSALRALKNT